MAEMNERFDSALLGILQHEGKIEKFLDAMFGFLYRRTDFYRIMKTKEDKMGFPKGVAVNILLNMYKKYEDLALKDEELKDTENKNQTKKSTAKTQGSKTTSTADRSNGANSVSQVHKQSKCKDSVDTLKDITTSDDKKCRTDTSNVMTEKSNVTQDSTKVERSKSENDDEKDENPELTRQQQMFQSNPESYNGAIRETYSWSQTITDVDVQVKVPSYIVKGRDVNVVINKKHLTVKHKNNTGTWEECVNGELSWEVNKEESMWNLIPGDHILINLEKKQERWWESILVSEPKINVRKIDASRPMSDLDDEAQAKIEEMMYNERQKRLGLPTSEQQKMHDMLRGAWDAEGSPFKGQPFDPSKLSVNQGGVVTINPDS